MAVIGHVIPATAKHLPPTEPLSWSLPWLMKQDIARNLLFIGTHLFRQSDVVQSSQTLLSYQRKWVAAYDE